MNLSSISYLSAALGFGFLAVLLLFSWRSSLQGRLLTVAAAASSLWALLAMPITTGAETSRLPYEALESLRYVAWFVFLLKLFEPSRRQLPGYQALQRYGLPITCGFAILLMVAELAALQFYGPVMPYDMTMVRYAGHLILALIALAIIEQLFRNVAPDFRSSLKYLFIGTGAIFAFDFYLYANALLINGIDWDLWAARGFINMATVPLLLVAAARNRNWSPNIFVSRDIVLHTTTIVGGGLYLLLMAVAGYYIQEFGGSWGRVAQAAFFSLAILFLVIVLFSADMRRQIRVFLGKHFYRNKYDYRHEWIHLTGLLSDRVRDTGDFRNAIRALAEIINAPSGTLWLADSSGKYRNRGCWNARQIDVATAKDASLVRFLSDKLYVINLMELETRPDEYRDLVLPDWLEQAEQPWLIVPLPGIETLVGFVVLSQPRRVPDVNWEDRDLLKTAARQLASHLAVLMAIDALSQARQFEVFNRLSSYMVHDLKNIAAGLELVARNAEKHGHNPEFLADAFDSVATASGDIRHLLDQLRNKRVEHEKKVMLDLVELSRRAAGKLAHRQPAPELDLPSEPCTVIAEQGRLENVLVHLIENAQQASTPEGMVSVLLHQTVDVCVIEIRDNGHGMDDNFIRERLFRPFDTTKGNAGIGIGMYESREFIRRLGGDIHVASEPGAGTQIKLVIPRNIDLPVDNPDKDSDSEHA